ncbi:hypothetical protein ACFL6I_08240 [candidate division KSB1 bacterium]
MLNLLTAIIREFPRADVSQHRLAPLNTPRNPVQMRVVIRDDLKAGGSIPVNFQVSMSPTGVKVDVTR